MKARDYYTKQSRIALKRALHQKKKTNAELAELLIEHGENVETQVLINKINRGTFSLRFALQCFAALGIANIPVPDFQRSIHVVKPKSKGSA